MSDKKEIKNLNNLTKIDFLRRERVQFDEFINKEEVHSILSLKKGHQLFIHD